MLKNLKEMTWKLILGHLFFLALGIFALVVVVIVVGYGREKLSDAIGVIAVGASITINSIISFLWFLFEKRKEEANPSTFQQPKDHELTTTH